MATEQIRLATELNAAKFSWARRVGQDHTSVLRASTIKHLNSCSDDACTGCAANARRRRAAAAAAAAAAGALVGRLPSCRCTHAKQSGDDDVDDDKSDDEDEEDEDVAEAKLLAKMRAARLSEMQDLAEAAKESLRAELGTHKGCARTNRSRRSLRRRPRFPSCCTLAS